MKSYIHFVRSDGVKFIFGFSGEVNLDLLDFAGMLQGHVYHGQNNLWTALPIVPEKYGDNVVVVGNGIAVFKQED